MLRNKSYLFVSSLFLLISFLILPQPISAQDSTALRGNNSLLFQIGSNFTLQSFDGVSFAYAYQQNKNTSLRFGVTLSGNSANTDDHEFFNQGDTTVLNTSERTNFAFSITAQYLVYNGIVNDVALYYGGGPVLGFSYMGDKSDHPAYNNYLNTNYKTNTWNLGLSMVCGVEWYINKKISLTAEYGATFGYNYTIQTMPATFNGATYNTSTVSFSPASAKLGISVYF